MFRYTLAFFLICTLKTMCSGVENMIFDYLQTVNHRIAVSEITPVNPESEEMLNFLLDAEDEQFHLLNTAFTGKDWMNAYKYVRNFVSSSDLVLLNTFIKTAEIPKVETTFTIDLSDSNLTALVRSSGAMLKQNPAFGKDGVFISGGTKAAVISAQGDWYQVKSAGRTGFVHTSLLLFTDSSDDDQNTEKNRISTGFAQVSTTDSGLNVRKGPGKDYEIITSLKPQTRVTVNSVNGTWAEIMHPAAGKSYVFSKYLTQSSDNSPITETAVCNVEELNIRKTPDSSGELLGVLKDGETVNLLNTEGSWRKIITQTGITGYAFKKYLVAGCEVPDFTDGVKAKLVGSSGILQYTRLWFLGSRENIRTIYFCNHGDHHTDYSDKIQTDLSNMKKHLKSGEGAIVALPLSVAKYWPGFDKGKNGRVLLSMFRHLEQSTGKENVRFEQFSLSGGGRLNHALLKLINENYGTDASVTELVDNHLAGIFDGDSLCYSVDDMRNNFITAIRNFPQIRFCFIHNTSGYMPYVHRHHNIIAQEIGNTSFEFGKSLSLQDGRLRFWAADTHFTAWLGQFEKVFFGN